MPLVSIADGALFAERLGSGSPRVLALHGWGRRGADFVSALRGLDVLAPDLPGFGASPPPATAVGAAGYARSVAPVLGMYDRPPVAVGHSFGGRVAVAMEHSAPGTFAGMVLIATPLVRGSGPRRPPPFRYRAARLGHRLGLVGDDKLEKSRRRHGSADYRAASGVMRDVLVTAVNESYEDELAGLRVPVHLLWGSADEDVPVSVARHAERIISAGGGQVELEVLEGAGHHLPLSAPEAVRAAVERMLGRVHG